MRFAWGTRGIAADGTNLFECATGFVKTMLALYDERVSEREVTMKNNPLVRVELDNEVDQSSFEVDVEHQKDKVL
jgi:hypothetical protein